MSRRRIPFAEVDLTERHVRGETVQVAVRVDPRLLGELEELLPLLRRHPDVPASRRLTRTSAIRFALSVGVARLREILTKRCER